MRYALCLTLLMVGCSTRPDVHPVGNGRYAVAGTTTAQASNGEALARDQAVRKATAFCAKQQQSQNAETFDDQTASRTYTTMLVFSCR
jgi:hypothetical protein